MQDRRFYDEALRATTSAAIAYQGEGILPLVQTAFYDSTNNRFSGAIWRAFFDALQASNDPEEIRDLMMLTNNSLRGDPRLPAAYITILSRTDDEKVSETAIQGLVMARESGRTAVEAALESAPANNRLRGRLTTAASLFRSNKAAN